MKEVILQVVAHQSADEIADPIVRLNAKRSALSRVVLAATSALDELNELETPPAQTRKASVMRKGARAAVESRGRLRPKQRKRR